MIYMIRLIQNKRVFDFYVKKFNIDFYFFIIRLSNVFKILL